MSGIINHERVPPNGGIENPEFQLDWYHFTCGTPGLMVKKALCIMMTAQSRILTDYMKCLLEQNAMLLLIRRMVFDQG